MLILITMIVSSIVVYHQTSTKLYDVSRAEMKSLTSSYIITLNHMIDKEKVKMDGMSNKKLCNRSFTIAQWILWVARI